MKRIIYILSIFSIVVTGCEYGELNTNPNAPTSVPGQLLITGTMLADISVNASHINRIAGLWSGQYKGYANLYKAIYEYNVSTEESNDSWSYLYNGIIAQNKLIQEEFKNDRAVLGISKVVEAHAVGTACANWGSIPYTEAGAGAEVGDPKFDSQSEVFAALQKLLDEAIADLKSTEGYSLSVDIFFEGATAKWAEVAYTLKARYYTLTREYTKAYEAAKNGISADANSMKYRPIGETTGNRSLWNEILASSRKGDIGTRGTYLESLLDGSASVSRNNSKTNEGARSKYYSIDEEIAKTADAVGVSAPDAPVPLVTYQENLLTLAETAARTDKIAEAISYLNDCRSFLTSGDAFKKVDAADMLQYDAYVEADFQSGGIENTDNIDMKRALLREIIEERYVSGYGTFMPWNDVRRLRKFDSDILVPFPLNNTSVTKYPERMLLSQNELNSNPNAPQGLTIIDKTELNK